MILDRTLKIEVKMDASATASNPEVTVDYIDWTPDGKPSIPATTRTALSHTTDVTVLAAPVFAMAREPLRIHIYNKDTQTNVITVKTDDGTTEFIEARQSVLTLRTLAWEKGSGWFQF